MKSLYLKSGQPFQMLKVSVDESQEPWNLQLNQCGLLINFVLVVTLTSVFDLLLHQANWKMWSLVCGSSNFLACPVRCGFTQSNISTVSSIYIWSENSRAKSEAKDGGNWRAVPVLSIVFVRAVNTNWRPAPVLFYCFFVFWRRFKEEYCGFMNW